MRATIIALVTICLLAGYAGAAIYLRDEGGSAGLHLGNCVSGLEDQDGDGSWELLVGAPGYQAAGQDRGRVYLWFGGGQFSLNADATWDGQAAEQFGHAVARIGDVNGDGRGDFAVGAPYASDVTANGGRVYVFYGADPLPTEADLVIEGPVVGGQFGWSIAAVGDFDDDGRDDFVVGAPYTNAGYIEAGAAYVFYGRNGDPHTTPDLTLEGGVAYGHFGWSVAGVDDFLGGNDLCLAVGAPSHDTAGTQIEGSVHVFRGGNVPDAAADLVLYSSATASANNEFGFAVAGIGSFDGDSDPDLIVGIPAYAGGGIDIGRAEIFYGGVDADDETDREADGPSSNSHFGWSVAGVGDIVGTSRPDVVIGAPYDDREASDSGRAFIWPGGHGDVGDADSLEEVDRGEPVAGQIADDHFGAWCAWVGDLDGDGLDDYAVAAPDGNVSVASVAGWVRVIDSSGASVPALLGVWRCRWRDDGAVVGEVPLYVSADQVTRVVFARLDPRDGGRTVIHAGPAEIAGGVLQFCDRDAAGCGDPLAYAVDVTLADGTVLELAPLAGPVGAAPAAVLSLAPAVPNPLNPRTVLRFRAAAGTPVSLRIFDLRGRLVRTLLQTTAGGGWQTATWDGLDDGGRDGAAGSYVVRLEDGQNVRHRTLMLVR